VADSLSTDRTRQIVERRAQSKLRLRLRQAAFDPTKTLESFDFSFNPKLNKAQVFDLATCHFIKRHENVLIYGPTGVADGARRGRSRGTGRTAVARHEEAREFGRRARVSSPAPTAETCAWPRRPDGGSCRLQS
jgi:IstB-like ATP binding protein